MSAAPALFANPDAPAVAALLRPAAADLFASPAWYRTVLRHAMPVGSAAVFAALPGALLALRAGPGRRLDSLTTPYTCRWGPLAARDNPDALATLLELCRGRAGTMRLEALTEEQAAALAAAGRAAGFRPLPYRHFGNWHTPLGGREWDAYLADRPGALRGTLRRRMRPELRLELLRTPGPALEAGLAAYQAVYARSWKRPEPYPGFNPALARALAEEGTLRLGLLHAPEGVVAAQFWALEGRRASVLKLAHDEAHRALSPGSVLTALMIRRLIGEDEVDEIDFGRGDDAYKQLWAEQRRQRMGLLLADPHRPTGLAALAHAALARATLTCRLSRRGGG